MEKNHLFYYLKITIFKKSFLNLIPKIQQLNVETLHETWTSKSIILIIFLVFELVDWQVYQKFGDMRLMLKEPLDGWWWTGPWESATTDFNQSNLLTSPIVFTPPFLYPDAYCLAPLCTHCSESTSGNSIHHMLLVRFSSRVISHVLATKTCLILKLKMVIGSFQGCSVL